MTKPTPDASATVAPRPDRPTSTSARISESIERAAWADVIEAAAPALRHALGLDVVAIGSGLALVCDAGGILLNRALGVAADERQLREVTAIYRARDIGSYFVHLHDGHRDDVAAAARAAGLVRYPRAWVKVMRGDGPVATLGTSLAIGTADAADALAAGELFAEAFDLAPALAPVFANLVGRDRWEVLVARDGDAIAGVGLVYVDDGVGYLAGGATAPRYRRHGVQGALMAARVRHALAAGCRWVTTETGEDVPGDPQHSFRNMIRCGFEVIARRDNFAPAGLQWRHGRRDGA